MESLLLLNFFVLVIFGIVGKKLFIESLLLLIVFALAILVIVRIISPKKEKPRYEKPSYKQPFYDLQYKKPQHKKWEYEKSAYYKITKIPFSSLKYDVGKYGEYLVYEHLRHFEHHGGKFLFNLLIPKFDGALTEIDVIFLCSKGILVFESKNFSGWIFGKDTQKNWKQILAQGIYGIEKNNFYNPIMQNASHIKHLRRFVGREAVIFSIIVFSDRCILKDVTITSCDVPVINLFDVVSIVEDICDAKKPNIYTLEDINRIYKTLYPFTQSYLEI